MRTIEIDNLILVEVPKDASDFKIVNKESLRTALLFSVGITAIPYELSNGNYETIGHIKTPNVDFDLEVDESWVESSHHYFGMFKNYIIESTNSHRRSQCFDKKQSFRTRIQRKIQDAGLYLVNPYGKKPKYDVSKADGSPYRYLEWRQAEEKTIKGNLLLIKKLQ